LSEESIEYAKQYEKTRLHFEVHDKRVPYPKTFDAVFNLFTSFGYSEKEGDNLRTIQAIKQELNPNGYAVIDFMNAELAIKNLVPKEKKKMGGIVFYMEKYVENDFIVKDIRFS